MSIGFHYDDIDLESMEKESPMYTIGPTQNYQIYGGSMIIKPREGLIYLHNQKDLETMDCPELKNGSIILCYE